MLECNAFKVQVALIIQSSLKNNRIQNANFQMEKGLNNVNKSNQPHPNVC